MDHGLVEDKERQDRVMAIAYNKGLQWGLPSFGLSAAGVYYAYKTVPAFSKKFGYSAMSGFPLMCGIFTFAVAAEQTMFDAHRNPELYGLEPADPNNKPKNWYIAPYKVIMNQYIGTFS